MKRRMISKLISICAVVSILLSVMVTPVLANGNGTNVGSSIEIDGLYDDWKKIPSKDITYTGTNGKDVHKAQLYTDGTYLYVHYQLSKFFTGTMPFGQFELTIGNVTQEFHIFNTDGGYYSCNAPAEPGEYKNLSVGVRGSKTGWNPVTLGNDVIFNVYTNPYQQQSNNEGAQFELRIPLDKLAKAYGMNKEEMDVITMYNSTLGSKGVSIAGTPTGPMIGLLIAVSMVSLGFILGLIVNDKKVSENKNSTSEAIKGQ